MNTNSPDGKMDKRTVKKPKERILKIAIRVFSEKGYSKTTIREVAKEAGISVGGVYLYFKNKEELYQTLLKYILDELVDKLKNAIKNIEDPVEAINTIMAINLNYAKKHKSFIIIEGKEHGFAFGTDIMKKRFSRIQQGIIEEIIKKGVTAGKFEECNAKDVTRIITSILRGFALSMIIDSKAIFPPEACCNLIFNGLLRRNEK